MILFVLRDAVDKALRKEQCGFRKGRGLFDFFFFRKKRTGRKIVDLIFTLRFIIEKCLSCQTSLVLSSIYFEQAFDSLDRKALAKFLSLYGIRDKCIRMISDT